MTRYQSAPTLHVSEWLNTSNPLHLGQQHGRVVMLHAFQMLCPGCVLHGLPQAAKVHEMYQAQDVTVIGLHTVFEHHAVMGADALKAFVHEYRLTFPIGIDATGPGDVPQTMRAYGLQGTPSLVLIDKQGRVRLNHFSRIDDLLLGSLIGQLRTESHAEALLPKHDPGVAAAAGRCDDSVCAVSQM